MPKTDDVMPEALQRLVDELPYLEQPAAAYPDTEVDAREGQDDLDELGAGTEAQSRRQAVRAAREWVATALWVGVGYCLKTVRSMFGVPALWPDAETASEHLEHLHPTTDPDRIPWGVPIWWRNGRYGHVAISVGKGRCITTDYGAPGRLSVAPIAALAPWCRGNLVGWSEDINGVRIWAMAYDVDDRIKVVRAALRQAEKDGAGPRKLQGLRKWLAQLEAKAKTS